MDNVDLNNSPDLTMAEITTKLFNNEFMSDIQFHVEGNVMFAHSWELMKRSIVFCEQFKGTLDDNKLIPLEDTTYKVFYQFLRFIYTDQCEIKEEMICEMLNLAVKYKIVKLETIVLNLKTSLDTNLNLFEFSLSNKYELYFNYVFGLIIGYLQFYCENQTNGRFFQLNPCALAEILKSDVMPSEITEVILFNTLVRWMDSSCETNQTPKSERRSHFEQLIRLIRFPLMTNDEFDLCVQNHPDLFTSDDISTICSQMVLKEKCKDAKWPTEPRLKYNDTWEERKKSLNQKWETKFTVSDCLILHGLRFGTGFKNFIIQICGTNRTTNATNVLKYNFKDSEEYYISISLGEKIKLKPNVDYTIEIIYEGENIVCCRKPGDDLIVTGPLNLVKFTEASENLFEIMFKLPTN